MSSYSSSVFDRVPVRRHEIVVGVGGLRVLVEVPHVGVRGRVVDVEVVLLHVLAVVPLGVGEAEHPLLQDRVLAVPQGERQTQVLAVVADPGDAVLTPAVGARAGLIVSEVVPGVAVLRCSPLGRCPTGARSGTVQTDAKGPQARPRRAGAAPSAVLSMSRVMSTTSSPLYLCGVGTPLKDSTPSLPFCGTIRRALSNPPGAPEGHGRHLESEAGRGRHILHANRR